MSTLSILVMVFVLTVVWGGFLLSLLVAIRKENQKH
jgi:type II secretory pathway component PulK